jgi:hypothetical protein
VRNNAPPKEWDNDTITVCSLTWFIAVNGCESFPWRCDRFWCLTIVNESSHTNYSAVCSSFILHPDSPCHSPLPIMYVIPRSFLWYYSWTLMKHVLWSSSVLFLINLKFLFPQGTQMEKVVCNSKLCSSERIVINWSQTQRYHRIQPLSARGNQYQNIYDEFEVEGSIASHLDKDAKICGLPARTNVRWNGFFDVFSDYYLWIMLSRLSETRLYLGDKQISLVSITGIL